MFNTIIEALATKREVDAILVLRSANTTGFELRSDIDLVMVLDEVFEPRLSSCFCYIGNNIGGVYFSYIDRIDEFVSSHETTQNQP